VITGVMKPDIVRDTADKVAQGCGKEGKSAKAI
jgi:hypothetical protein